MSEEQPAVTAINKSEKTAEVVIIGAGIGGLSTAIRLAAAGKAVTLFEQNAQVGGKMGEVTHDGFRWDTGPSVITMYDVFADLFAVAGRKLDDYLTLQPVDPLTRYFYPDGTVLDITRDWPTLAAQLAQLDERDIQGYLNFLAYAAKLHRITGPVFIYDQPPSLQSLRKVAPWEFLKIDPWLTLDQAIRRHIHSPHLRQLLGRFATYVGASPYAAPATLGVIADVELTGGVWYPKGGIFAIATALATLARELGVTIETNCSVGEINVVGGKAVGVTLSNGTTVQADRVIANVDVTHVYTNLLPGGAVSPTVQTRLLNTATSCSGYVLLLGVAGEHPQLAHHNIFFSSDYPGEFCDIFDLAIPPRDPTIYVAITSKTDPSHAPEGCENWFVLVNAPPLATATESGFDWANDEAAYRDHVLDILASFGYNIREKLRHVSVRTPVDLAEQTGAWRGALYGISSNNALNAFRRPHNRCPDIAGLYFVGGTTHPGGGVPMVTLSGKVVAEMVLADWH